ncbi:hypothetical protein GCM10010123_34680 [Pilimelia anulata]|uniref:VOC domain-containing protein n=1 Tax=Pilimelia anulata TaxID=53371 RepID=A0A8J3BEN1_9ACTN|nr:VOC family protein [Pilimelia anulata]GGK01836.1 hypothetical protein GCM10010123_34680 [Pilimelia anulata]
MQGIVTALIPVVYVQDLDRSRAFWELFGFTADREGGTDDSTWCYLRCGDSTLLLADVRPPLFTAELPLQVYVWVDDLDAVTARLAAAGHAPDHAGHPDHAAGGEVRVVDPDGNVVVYGMRDLRPGQPAGDGRSRYSITAEAAAASARRGRPPAQCRIGVAGGAPCPSPAEVKLADPWGETVWGCIPHAEEALFNAHAAFIAADEGQGLTPFLRARRKPR